MRAPTMRRAFTEVLPAGRASAARSGRGRVSGAGWVTDTRAFAGEPAVGETGLGAGVAAGLADGATPGLGVRAAGAGGAGLAARLASGTRSGDTSSGGKPAAMAVPDIQHSKRGIRRRRVLRGMTG
ncbi:hypothetical protein MASR2M16_17590 [Thauera terpenica]